jgi:penicillin-binding protein 2
MAIGREEKVPATKFTVVQYAILAIFLGLGFGLWRLQVIGAAEYETRAEQNRVRTIPILAPRGKIKDREGRVIVDNYPSFSALLIREDLRDLNSKLPKIAAGLNISPEEIKTILRRMAGRTKSEPAVLKQDITPDEVAFIEANRTELPELETIMVHRRLYPRDGFAAHLVGYVGEVSESDLDRPQFELYNQGDIVGKSGLEYQYNDLLIGKNGARRVLVDTKGKEVGRWPGTPSEAGKELKLTIDLDLQIAAEEALEGHNGAIVAMDPRNGEILALVSRPTFDPNHFAVRISRDEWNGLVNDPAKPLMNKAIQAQLAPGSVFKIIMAVAGVQENITQNLVVNCGGGREFYGRHFKCWVVAERRTHGSVDLAKGIYQSCDTYFYTLGERLGIGRIAKYAQEFGVGKRTGIDLPEEVTGVMPSEEWKIRTQKVKWYAGETISVSIGQGAVTTTPIQLARAIGAIASEGRLVHPHTVIVEELPQSVREHLPNFNEVKVIPIQREGWETITDAMAEVVNPIGTAPSAHLKDIDFAGKTGSAQVISNTLRAKLKGHEYKDNGWFAGVTPRRNPEIVVTTLIEQGEHGYLAARVTAQVIKAFVEKKKRQQLKTAQAKPAAETVEIGALWSATTDGKANLQGGHFRIPVEPAKKARSLAFPAFAAASGGN